MAFKNIRETHEGVSFKRYNGVGAFTVLAVNPTLQELNSFGYNQTTEPVYIGKTEDGLDKADITLLVKTIPEKNNGIDQMFKLVFNLKKRPVKGSTSGKYKIIDNYGRTAWATPEDVQAKKVPVYNRADGTTFVANIDANYHVLCDGEENITEFFRTLLGIKDSTKFVDGKPAGTIDNLEEAEGSLEHIKDYFLGNVAELKELVALGKNNWIKLLIGVRTTSDGKQYQTVYNRKFVLGASNSYRQLSKSLQDDLAAGRYADTYFGDTIGGIVNLTPLKEMEIAATNIQPANAPMPVAAPVVNTMGVTDMPF